MKFQNGLNFHSVKGNSDPTSERYKGCSDPNAIWVRTKLCEKEAEWNDN